MKATLILLAMLTLAGCGSEETGPAPTPSVAVSVAMPRQGSIPRWLTAYGSVMPSSMGTETLSVPQAGQVVRVSVTAGAIVQAGQPLATFAVAPSTLSGFEAATTALAAARKQRDTTATLLSQQLATRDQLTQAEKAVADAQATLDALRREGAGQAVQTIRAPFDGVVTAIPVAPGDRTQPGAALLTVARRGAIIVTVGIDPAERAHVRIGQPARLHPLDGGATEVAGQVLRIDGQLNATTHLVDIDLGFPAGAILPGQTLGADIATGTSSGWIVPHASVVTGDDGARVFQIANGKARAVPVDIVQTGPRQDVVTGRLDPAQPLIVDGAYQVEDGDAVRRQR